ncbi:MAG: TetR family transcriptional regulator [Oceanospirillaceae bacterium]|uniref:TetR family transcriptional regulator n=1 Tax=Marinobacterium litorale TaxID=404770 RepID=UPI000488DE47|nr:TetR family transcriptional regulator [Marinobacterium litorale]MBT00453.1 TetR family transcriptional regulator [Oceanospirillaceae bacterium]
MRRTKEEAEQTRLQIMSVALELFARQGIAATSLTGIARAAGVTRGAIYWHFKNKWDLFDAIWQHYSGPINALGEASQAEDEADPLGKLAQLFHLVLFKMENDEGFRRMIVMCSRESAVWGQDIPDRIKQFQEELHQKRRRTLENAMRKGQLPADLDPDAGSLMIKVMLEGVLMSWLQRPDCFSIADRADQIVESIMVVLKQGVRLQPVNRSPD